MRSVLFEVPVSVFVGNLGAVKSLNSAYVLAPTRLSSAGTFFSSFMSFAQKKLSKRSFYHVKVSSVGSNKLIPPIRPDILVANVVYH